MIRVTWVRNDGQVRVGRGFTSPSNMVLETEVVFCKTFARGLPVEAGLCCVVQTPTSNCVVRALDLRRVGPR